MKPTSPLADLLRGNGSAASQKLAAEALMRLAELDLEPTCPLCHEWSVLGADHMGGCPIRIAREMAG